METELEATCDTPGCMNRVRRYPWNSEHRHETRYCIPCALERQRLVEWTIALGSGTQAIAAGKELAE
jgi:hypothetical protein